MIRNWMFKLSVPIIALVLMSACNTTNNNDEAPQNDNEGEEQVPENQGKNKQHPGHDDSKDTNLNPDELEGYQ